MNDIRKGEALTKEYGRDAQCEIGKVKRWIWLIPGALSFLLGVIGTILPIWPTVPFFMAALFCFAKGSERMHCWFINTKLYHKHLETFVDKKSMTVKTKATILGTITVFIAIGFLLMKGLLVGRIILASVWVAHIVYFVFFIKTEKESPADFDN